MRVLRQRKSDVIGMRLASDAVAILDREVERTGRYPASIVSNLIRVHLGSIAGCQAENQTPGDRAPDSDHASTTSP